MMGFHVHKRIMSSLIIRRAACKSLIFITLLSDAKSILGSRLPVHALHGFIKKTLKDSNAACSNHVTQLL